MGTTGKRARDVHDCWCSSISAKRVPESVIAR
jgi:hypothetical protein